MTESNYHQALADAAATGENLPVPSVPYLGSAAETALEIEYIDPIEDHVFIRPDVQREAERRTPSGRIIVPDTVKDPADTPERGEVLFIGPGLKTEDGFQPTKCKLGDEIIFHRNSGTSIRFNGEELICMRESGVWGVIRKRQIGANLVHPVIMQEPVDSGGLDEPGKIEEVTDETA